MFRGLGKMLTYEWNSQLLQLIVLATVLWSVTGQVYNPPAGKYEFSMDRTTDCDGKVREVGRSIVSISGKSSVHTDQNVLSCTLTLNTDSAREPMRFKIQFLQVKIDDMNVQFSVYDGEFDGRKMWTFSRNQPIRPNLQFDFTTGQRVTFRLSRGQLDSKYDIRLNVEPVVSDVSQCIDQIDGYNCNEYGYTYRILGTKEIIGIVAGAFGLVVFIVIIVVVCCYRRQRGISRRWKEHRLGEVNTAASIHSLNGRVTNDSNKAVWASESSKIASIRRSPVLPRARITRPNNSYFESSESLQGRPLPPTNRSNRGTNRRRDYKERGYDDESERTESDRSYSTRDNYKPPTYREALRRDSESEIGHATDHSFVRGDEDIRPGKPFIERELAPRAKPRVHTSSTSTVKKQEPTPDEDETYDSIEPKKVSKALGPDDDDEITEEEGSTETEEETSEEEEEEEESEEEESEEDNKVDETDKAVLYSKPNKEKSKRVEPEAQVPPKQPGQQPAQWTAPPMGQPYPAQFQQGPAYPGFFPPGVHQPQPRYGYPPQQMQPMAAPGNPYMQAQFSVPVNPGAVPQYPGVHYPTQGQNPKNIEHGRPSNRSHHGNKPAPNSVPGNQLPIYSYLVNRGYQPVDGRYSPVSTSTGGSNLSRDNNYVGHTDDSDFSANLDSGVELMKRSTAK